MHVNHSKEIVAAARNDPNFLKSIVTGDDTWRFQYDPKTKLQSAEWKSKNSLKTKKTRKVPSKMKTLLITFFDIEEVVNREFVPTGQAIIGALYLEVLKRLLARIRHIRPAYRDPET